MQSRGRRSDVYDRVDRTDLVKVDLFERNAVHARLGHPQRLEDRERPVANRRLEPRALEQLRDRLIAAPLRVGAAVRVSLPSRSAVLVRVAVLVVGRDVSGLRTPLRLAATRNQNVDVASGQRPAAHLADAQLEVHAEPGEIRVELASRQA